MELDLLLRINRLSRGLTGSDADAEADAAASGVERSLIVERLALFEQQQHTNTNSFTSTPLVRDNKLVSLEQTLFLQLDLALEARDWPRLREAIEHSLEAKYVFRPLFSSFFPVELHTPAEHSSHHISMSLQC